MHLKPIHDTLGTPLKGVTATGGQRVLQFYLFILFVCKISSTFQLSQSAWFLVSWPPYTILLTIILSSLYKYVVHFLILFLNSIRVSQTHDIFRPLHHDILPIPFRVTHHSPFHHINPHPLLEVLIPNQGNSVHSRHTFTGPNAIIYVNIPFIAGKCLIVNSLFYF